MVKPKIDPVMARRYEYPDPTPPRMPAGFKRPDTLAEQVQRLVRGALSRHAANQGDETFEESEDFDVGEDFDPTTPYEEFFDPVLQRSVTPQEFKTHEDRYRKEVLDRQANYYRLQELERRLEEGIASDPETDTGGEGERPLAKP